MPPLETTKDIVKYFSSPLELPEAKPEIYTLSPYTLEIDAQINEILARYKRSDVNRTLSLFSLLDSTVIIPPIDDKYKTVSYQKAITYGDYVDLYIYKNPIIKIKRPKSKISVRYPRDTEEFDRSGEYRRRNSIKALNRIRQLTMLNFSNDYVKLLTLTFGDCDFDITDPRICNKKLSRFLQKLRKLYPTFKYIGVIEFQKRGAVHYHILCDLPFTDKDKLAEMWGYGFIDIRKPDYVIGRYLFKYLAKDLNDAKLKGVRVYFCSKNLNKPKTATGLNAYDIAKSVQNTEITFANSYFNKYNGDVIQYRQLKIPPAQTNNV